MTQSLIDNQQMQIYSLKSQLTKANELIDLLNEEALSRIGVITHLESKLEKVEELIGKAEVVLESVKEVKDEECDFDHHGYCQAHNLEKDCHVARASELLEEIAKWRGEK